MNSLEKIVSWETLKHLRSTTEESGQKIVFTNGCFDILHRGHVEYLEKARELGDMLIVGLNSDDSVRRLKGNYRPLVPQMDRAFLLGALSCVDYVVIFQEDTPLELIDTLQPDILIKGGDYQITEIVGRDVVMARGGKVETIPLIPNRSTTNVIQKIITLTQKGIL